MNLKGHTPKVSRYKYSSLGFMKILNTNMYKYKKNDHIGACLDKPCWKFFTYFSFSLSE